MTVNTQQVPAAPATGLLGRTLAFVRELHDRNRWLSTGAWLNLALAGVALSLLPFDDRLVTGINPWIKPLKFSLSVMIYLGTLAWLVPYIDRSWLRKSVVFGACLSMAIEMPLIFLQAARGSASHFNIQNGFDATIFSAMGTFIALNTVAAVLALVGFWITRAPLPRSYLWAIRLGLIVFLVGSAVGGQMVGNMAHTVGAADGGPGLPFVNWSTKAGDLRIAHGMGLHALQAIPIVGYLLSRRRAPVAATRLTFAIAVVYLSIVIGLYLQAASGQPLIVLP